MIAERNVLMNPMSTIALLGDDLARQMFLLGGHNDDRLGVVVIVMQEEHCIDQKMLEADLRRVMLTDPKEAKLAKCRGDRNWVELKQHNRRGRDARK